ncbi:MAG: DUF1343 domain-containing protein, partial [Blastocatellia bacterium]
MSSAKKLCVRTGVDILLNDRSEILTGLRIGLVCNQASVLSDLTHIADAFFHRNDITLTALFGPQHGIRGDVQDNMIETEHMNDTRTGLP